MQFELVARANEWNEAAKVTVLSTSLKGEACSVREGLEGFSGDTLEVGIALQ